ncbi:hypothetical protein [Streptomyces gobiensis]|uniref:hypothetical protein n=1 Tax=Streptomyces gobiensis TaxID=2875706 RepID=UPI0030D0F0B3
MPDQVADAIVRLEEHNLRVDEQFAASQNELVQATQEAVKVTRVTAQAQTDLLKVMDRMAGRAASAAAPHQQR